MHPSCDPCVVLDNPTNRTRRKGDMVQQLATMVLGRATDGQDAVDPPASKHAAASGTPSRGLIKRWQVESFALVLQQLVLDVDRPLAVVDFGCGTGSLLLPLAALFPSCSFVGVEMKPAAVVILEERARAAGLSNVATRRGMIEDFDEPFDVALALHACGNATDAVLLRAVHRRAAYLVSPCCVGKLKFSMTGGSSFSPHLLTYTPRMPGDRPTSSLDTQQPAAAAAAAASAGAGGHAALPDGAQPSACSAGPGLARVAGAGALLVDAGSAPQAAEGAAEAAAAAGLPALQHPRSRWLRQALPDPDNQFMTMARAADADHSKGAGGSTLPPPPSARRGEQARSSSAAAAAGATPASSAASTAAPLAPAGAVDAGDGAYGSSTNASGFAAGNGAAVGSVAGDAAANGHAAMDGDGGGGGGGGVQGCGDLPPPTVSASASALCKLFVELDRNEAAREQGYCVGLYKLLNWQSMAKGELLVGVPAERALWAYVAAQLPWQAAPHKATAGGPSTSRSPLACA